MNLKTLDYINEHYERIRVLGQGSFGTAIVYRRRADCALVVLKEIDLLRFKYESNKRFALEEARIMSELSHDNIIRYYNAYITEKKLIIEMEYARLGTLQTYISRLNELLEEEEILSIFRQILTGLSYLHRKNIVHLDLKMVNIFVSSEGVIKIGDFGIAKMISTPSQKTLANINSSPASQQCTNINHRQLGTLAYSSPERCMGLPTNFKSDIWSLGCILYELITLEPLFTAESLPELVVKITQIEYKPIERNILPGLKNVFEHMIARNADERPNADEILGLIDQTMMQLEAHRQQYQDRKGDRNTRANRPKPDGSTELAFLAQDKRHLFNQIKYPHSLVYQIRIDSSNIAIDRVNLPQSKRIKEISKGKSHYLVLTYDNIVYGWGSCDRGQLGACNMTTSTDLNYERHRPTRSSRSATNSFTANMRGRYHRDDKKTSLTQPPSLASSTQTILATASSSPVAQRKYNKSDISGRGLSSHSNQELLHHAKPVSKPFIINELNKRKIERIAAGDDFSVFLSKTGIVMTCGYGFSGCLGRGNRSNCTSPCMVDSLLNMDVVDIACGPQHVMAICGDGQVFSWGNSSKGRLGHSPEVIEQFRYRCSSRGIYIVTPLRVIFKSRADFSDTILIKGVICGDRCTVFIDSNFSCWACGDNRFNKLGLDIKRRFKRTIVIKYAWCPTRITALGKHKIISCKIGKNHSSFLTIEGKMIIFGRDIDHSFRLKRSLNKGSLNKSRSHELGSRELLSRSLTFQDYRYLDPFTQSQYKISPATLRHKFKSNIHHKKLIDSLLYNNQMIGFKELYSGIPSTVKNYPKLKTSRVQRKRLESYLKESRSSKKMPFESVIDMCCTSKFTLALTNDNRVYFWGIRSYARSEGSLHCPILCDLNGNFNFAHLPPKTVEPQLVAGCSDDCIVKIGSTNSTLMAAIELMGSDQPILQARDPRLIARSLADLWILDYRPETPESSSTDSVSSYQDDLGSYCCSVCSKTSENSSDISSYSDEDPPLQNPSHQNIQPYYSKVLDCTCYHKYDAILEPQPIVSLYVPSIFNHNGGDMKLVSIFCFDEDRFFLILDTTVNTLQQRLHRPTSAKVLSRSSNQSHMSGNNYVTNSPANPSHIQRQAQKPVLDIVKESTSIPVGSNESSHSAIKRTVPYDVTLRGNTMSNESMAKLGSFPLKQIIQAQNSPISSHTTDRPMVAAGLLDDSESKSSSRNDEDYNVMQASPESYGLSLEEPRSMSTFAPALTNHIIMCKTNNASNAVERLNFTNNQNDDTGLQVAERIPRRRYPTTMSESTAITGDDIDETSSMPTWVRNEYIENEQVAVETTSRGDLEQNFADDESSYRTHISSSSTKQTCLTKGSTTVVTTVTSEDETLRESSSNDFSHEIQSCMQSQSFNTKKQFNVTNHLRSYVKRQDLIESEERGTLDVPASLLLRSARSINLPPVVRHSHLHHHSKKNINNLIETRKNLSPSKNLWNSEPSIMNKASGSKEDGILFNLTDCCVYKTRDKYNSYKSINRVNSIISQRSQRFSPDRSGPLTSVKIISASSESIVDSQALGDELAEDTKHKHRHSGGFCQIGTIPKMVDILNTMNSARCSSSCADVRDPTITRILEANIKSRDTIESSELVHHQSNVRKIYRSDVDFSRKAKATKRTCSRTSLNSIKRSLIKIFC